MNVLQIVPELNAGGVERTVIEMAEALSRAGHTPHVASLGGRMEADLIKWGGVLHRFDVGSKNPLKLRGHTKTLIDIIKDHHIDIVHARSRAPAWAAHAAARATDRPFVTTYHGIYNASNRMKRRYNAVMTKGDLIIANSEFTKAHIIQEHGTAPDTIIAIPRGVDMARFDPALISEADIAAQRRGWHVDTSQKIVLLPGRLTRWKGQLVAIEALAALKVAHPSDHADTVLVLLGDAQGRADYVAEINAKIAALHLTDHVRLVDHSQNMPAALAASDCVVSASTDPEAFGRVAIEAQAMQRPIIATAHGGALETVLDGETGFLVALDQPEAQPDTQPDTLPKAMADGLARALNWPDYQPHRVRARIAAQFSKATLQSATLAVYGRLLSPKP